MYILKGNSKNIMRKFTFILTLFSTSVLFAQDKTDYRRASQSNESNYFEIVDAYREKLDAKKRRGGQESVLEIKDSKHFERWAYFWRNRVDSDGTFPNRLQGWYNAGVLDENGQIVTSEKDEALARRAVNPWVNIGPTELPEKNGYPNYPQMGRLNTFWRYKHPTNTAQNILLVGAPTGGLWKSTNNGTTWSPKLDKIAGIGITDIASSSSSTSNNGVIYVSTGDYDGPDVSSIGVYKSTDLGETFSPTGLTFTLDEKELLSDLVVLNDNTVIVGVNGGIKKTTNGGNTWSYVYEHDFNNQFGRFARTGSKIMCQDLYGGVYYSSNSGNSWTQVRADGNSFGGSAVTVDKSTAIFYVQTYNGQVFKFNSNLSSPSLVATGTIPADYSPQSSFNQALVYRDGLLISGGVDGLSSTNEGATWYNSLNGYWDDNSSDGVYVHSDHHDLDVLDGGFSFYSCNDGGLTFINYATKNTQKPSVDYKSSNIPVTQIYSVAITPQNENYYMIGNQDNDGYSREMHNGELKWVSASAGDGTCTAIDYSNPNIRYLGDQNKNLYRTTTGFSGNYLGTKLSTPTGGNFFWPLELHSTNPSILYGGFRDINKSSNRGDSWTNLNSDAGTIKFIETFGDVLMVIGKDKAVKSMNGGSTWQDITEPYNKEEITSISFNQSNPNIIYASVPGYREGEKVYKSTDGGDTWSNITGNLPNIVMNEIKLYQNQTDEILFLGTELGVYTKKNNGAWEKYGDDLPNVIIYDMEINYTAEKLVVATFGRGVWQIDLNESVTALNDSKENENNGFVILNNTQIKESLTLDLKDERLTQFIVYNTVGGVIKRGTVKKGINVIDVSNSLNGVYVIKLSRISGLSETEKFYLKK